MATPKYDSSIAYQSVSVSPEMSSNGEGEKPQFELGNHPQLARKRSWIATFVIQWLSLLWLVPVVVLLYLNFSGWVIGASAWCPGGQCWLGMFNPVTSTTASNLVKFDKESHNLLGGLQLVAKALEVWFVFVAAALVYLITMNFASKKEGLPIGYLTRPVEFADPVTLVDPLLWVTGPSPYGSTNPGKRRVGMRVWFLIGFSVFLCGLCNLMGPATAVLVIPALQWITTKEIGNRQYLSLNAGVPPGQSVLNGDYSSWIWDNSGQACYEPEFRQQLFSCMYSVWGIAFDSWLENYVSADSHIGTTPQDFLTMSANSTSVTDAKNVFDTVAEGYRDRIFWAPSRQIVSNLSTDVLLFSDISKGFTNKQIHEYLSGLKYQPDPTHTYEEYNKSLSLDIRRNGPVLGASITMWADYNDRWSWHVDVDANRQIKCYNYYDVSNTPLGDYDRDFGYYTRCIRVGSGWSDKNKQAHFSVLGQHDYIRNTTNPGVDVSIYSSDRAVFFPNYTTPDWLPMACLGVGNKLNSTVCDWDRIFASDPSSDLYNRTRDVNTIEYSMTRQNRTAKFVVDFNPTLAFTEYSINPSPIENRMQLIQLQNLPTYGKSVHMDPTWMLAAWNVDANSLVWPDRSSFILLENFMSTLITNQTQGVYIEDLRKDYLGLVPVMQALSLVDHNTTYISDPTTVKDKNPDQPMLNRYARMYVWAYGVGSRTSEMGVVVAIMGCLVVVAQVVMGFWDRRRYRSPTQLLVAALEHCPRGEFEGKGHDEKAMARVRFHIQDDDNHTGKFSFFEPQFGDQSEPQERHSWRAHDVVQ